MRRFVIWTRHQILFDDQIKEEEVDGSYDTNEEEEKTIQNFLWESWRERVHLENLREEQSVILK